MTEFATTDWGFSIVSNISFGEGAAGTIARFRFRNNKSRDVAEFIVKSVGGTVSATPITFELNLKPKLINVPSKRPIDLEDLDGCGVAIVGVGFSPFIHPIVHKLPWMYPTTNRMDIVFTGKGPGGMPRLLMKITVTDKDNMGSFRFSTPGGGGSTVAGNMTMSEVVRHLRPMIPKLLPIRPVLPPVPPPKPPRPIVPPKPPRRFDISADVAFDFDTAKLKQEAYYQLFEIITELNSGPWSRVRIEGHADSAGSVAYNQDLSLARAYAVRDWLGQQGAKNARGFEVIGHSELKPKASNATAAGRALNRRVEISLFQ